MDYSKLDGLVPAVVQDSTSLEVLMVGFMNEAALDDLLTDAVRQARSAPATP